MDGRRDGSLPNRRNRTMEERRATTEFPPHFRTFRLKSACPISVRISTGG